MAGAPPGPLAEWAADPKLDGWRERLGVESLGAQAAGLASGSHLATLFRSRRPRCGLALDLQGRLVDVNVGALAFELLDVWGAADAGLVEHLLTVGSERADEADALPVA